MPWAWRTYTSEQGLRARPGQQARCTHMRGQSIAGRFRRRAARATVLLQKNFTVLSETSSTVPPRLLDLGYLLPLFNLILKLARAGLNWLDRASSTIPLGLQILFNTCAQSRVHFPWPTNINQHEAAITGGLCGHTSGLPWRTTGVGSVRWHRKWLWSHFGPISFRAAKLTCLRAPGGLGSMVRSQFVCYL